MMERIDSFSIYADANGSIPLIDANQVSMLRRWTGVSGNHTNTGPTGALHHSCLSMPFGGGLSLTLSHQSTWIVGFRYAFITSTGLSQAGANIWEMRHNDGILFDLRLNTNGTLSLRTASSAVIDTSTFAIIPNTRYYIDFTVSFSGTTNIAIQADLWIRTDGGVGTHIAGGSVLTGVNMAGLLNNSATTNVHEISSGGAGADSAAYIQDLYIFNGTAPNNARLDGKIRIAPLHPNGDVVTEFTPSAAGTHFHLVNELPEDQDASYVEDDVVSDQDIYDWQNVPSFAGTVPAVQLSTCARKTEEGQGVVEAVVGDTGTEAQSQKFYLSNSYRWYMYPIDIDPATVLPWTKPGFNAKRFGQRVVAL